MFVVFVLCPGGDARVGGHDFKVHTFAAQWCDVCGRFLWGLVRQGLKCEGQLEGGRGGGRRAGGCTNCQH